MEHLEKIINLTFNHKDFQEIYFKDNQESMFFNPTIKPKVINLTVVLLLFLISISYSYVTNDKSWLIAIFATLLLPLFLSYFYSARKIMNWKREINTFFKVNEKYKTHKYILTQHSITLQQDNDKEIWKWSEFGNAKITDDYLILVCSKTLLIPKKSVAKEDYEYLIDQINIHVKNGL